jgi:hypothetical protein
MRRALMIGLLAAGSLSGGTARSEPPRDGNRPAPPPRPGPPPSDQPPRTEKCAYLGLAAAPAPRPLRRQVDLPQGVGLVVEAIVPGSPAADAGLRVDDLLHKLNDQILVNPQQLAVLVRTFKPGDTLRLTVVRAGKPVELTAKLVEKELRPLDEMRLGGDPLGSPFGPGPFGDNPFGPGDPTAQLERQLERLRATMRQQQQQNQDRMPPAAVDGGDAADPFPPGLLTNESFALMWYDGVVSMRITTAGGRRTLVARDRAGKELYNGPIDTDAQRNALPTDVKERLEQIGPPDCSAPAAATVAAPRAVTRVATARRAAAPPPPARPNGCTDSRQGRSPALQPPSLPRRPPRRSPRRRPRR